MLLSHLLILLTCVRVPVKSAFQHQPFVTRKLIIKSSKWITEPQSLPHSFAIRIAPHFLLELDYNKQRFEKGWGLKITLNNLESSTLWSSATNMLLLTQRMEKETEVLRFPRLAEICTNQPKELRKSFFSPLTSTWKFSDTVVKTKEQVLGPSNPDQNWFSVQ